jgi:hypothetical protein
MAIQLDYPQDASLSGVPLSIIACDQKVVILHKAGFLAQSSKMIEDFVQPFSRVAPPSQIFITQWFLEGARFLQLQG